VTPVNLRPLLDGPVFVDSVVQRILEEVHLATGPVATVLILIANESGIGNEIIPGPLHVWGGAGRSPAHVRDREMFGHEK